DSSAFAERTGALRTRATKTAQTSRLDVFTAAIASSKSIASVQPVPWRFGDPVVPVSAATCRAGAKYRGDGATGGGSHSPPACPVPLPPAGRRRAAQPASRRAPRAECACRVGASLAALAAASAKKPAQAPWLLCLRAAREQPP